MVGKMPDIAVLMCQPYGGILHTLHFTYSPTGRGGCRGPFLVFAPSRLNFPVGCRMF